MPSIESGTTTERIVRTAVLTVLLGAYSAWSLWDGYVTYPRANLVSVLANKLGVEAPDPLPMIHPQLTARVGERIADGNAARQVVADLGGEPLRHDGKVYCFGPSGYLAVVEGDAGTAAFEWAPAGVYSAKDLLWQKTVGFGLAPLALAFVVQLVRVLATRVTLTAAGLAVGRRAPIPFDAMTGLRGDQYARTGCVTLEYTTAGRPHRVKLDAYVVKETRAIIAAVCEAKGFASPLEASGPDTSAPDGETPSVETGA